MVAESSQSPLSEPAPLAPVAPPVAFDDRVMEADFQDAVQLLLTPPASRQKLTLLLLSLAAFVVLWLIAGDGSPVDLAILVGVVFVHELGHAIGMRAFGYQDVRVFFVPLFGGAASGRPRGVARSKQAIVLLLGPLPGIVAGCALAWLGGPAWLHTTAVMLIAVNALNLLPVEPLDGGQLFQVLVFSRHRYLEIVFRGATTAVVIAASVYFKLWVLAGVGYLLLVTLPQRARLLAGAARLRTLGWPDDPAALDDAQRRTLYRAAWDSLPARWQAKWRKHPRPQAAIMEQMLARATERPPSALASAGVFGLWLAGLALAVAGSVGAIRSPAAPPPWERYENRAAAFSVELPGHAVVATGDPASKTSDGIASAVWHGARYEVMWRAVPSSEDWLRTLRAQLTASGSADRGAVLVEDEYWLASPTGPRSRAKLVAGSGFGYILAVTPGDDDHAQRMFDSFRAGANPRF